ncbi:MAG: hypothetical protein GY765_36815 [bacterium]|nr:hypothetical protein [bacterium]
MWKLLKSEITYNKYIFILLFAIQCIAFLLMHLLPQHCPNTTPLLITLILDWLCITFFYYDGAAGRKRKESRITRRALLPVKIRIVALERFLIPFLAWMVLIGLYIVFILVSGHFQMGLTEFMMLLSITGFAQLTTALFFLSNDLPVMLAGTISQWVANSMRMVLLFVPMVLLYTFMVGWGQSLDGEHDKFLAKVFTRLSISSPTTAIIFIGLGAALTIMSIKTFEKRKSYII